MPTIKTQIKEAKHRCDVNHDPQQTCLPQLPPHVNHFKKWVHNLRRHIIVSDSNFRTIFVFRSSFMLRAERRRHVKKYPWYIIHPFSNFYTIMEVLMAFTWGFAFVKDPLGMAILSFEVDLANKPWQVIDLLLDLLQMTHVCLCFITGYVVVETKEVVLTPTKIVHNYLKTYFLFDILGSMPLGVFFSYIAPSITDKNTNRMYLGFFRLCRLVRIRSMAHYMRTITNFLKISDQSHRLIMILIVGVYILHWFACALAIAPRFYEAYYEVPNPNTWLNKANKRVYTQKYYKYMWAFNIIMSHFVSAGPETILIEHSIERTIVILSCIVGIVYVCIALSIMLISVSTSGSSESKYEELLHQLMEYCKQKRLPLTLRAKLHMYYEHRFQKHYFKEADILDSISLYMKYQIILHSCKYLFDTVKLFNGLSKTVLGTIIASLQNEVFLPGDTVTLSSEGDKFIYFIAYGTVALYEADGLEISHLIDGDVFGIINLLAPQENIIKSIVAVETSDVFKLSDQDFLYCMRHFSDFNKKVNNLLKSSIELFEHVARQIKETKMKKADIVFDLRRKRIIEQNRFRRKDKNVKL